MYYDNFFIWLIQLATITTITHLFQKKKQNKKKKNKIK